MIAASRDVQMELSLFYWVYPYGPALTHLTLNA